MVYILLVVGHWLWLLLKFIVIPFIVYFLIGLGIEKLFEKRFAFKEAWFWAWPVLLCWVGALLATHYFLVLVEFLTRHLDPPEETRRVRTLEDARELLDSTVI